MGFVFRQEKLASGKGPARVQVHSQEGRRPRRRRGRIHPNRGGFHNRLGAPPEARAALPGLREALRRLRQAPGPQVAGARRRGPQALRGVRVFSQV